MPVLRLALAQLNVTVGDLDGNRRLIAEAIWRARAWRADVVLVPELAVSGYPPEDLLLKPQFVAENQRVLEQLRPLTQGIVAVIGCVLRDSRGRLSNAAAVLAGGCLAAVYRKQSLPNYGVFDERRYFTPGQESVLLTVGGVRCGLTICEDLWDPRPCQALAARGAQLVLNLSASPYHAGKGLERQRLFAERARRHRVAIAYCNLVGGQDDLVFDGASLVLDARGRMLARAGQFRDDFVVVDIAAVHLAHRPVHGATVTLSRSSSERPAAPKVLRPPLSPLAEIYEALTLGVRDYVRKNGFSTVVLGMSGGVDSALTACIAVDALGPAHVMGLVMPSRYSAKATQRDARQLAAALGIEAQEMSIEPLFQAALDTLKPFFLGRSADAAEQNVQARIRGLILMAFSNKFGWLVLTTGNKSELATGYCTLYGDMAGGFAVIKDVPKMLVYALARYRNARGPSAVIPPSILTRVPSAELAPRQTDQDTLPPYEMLDRIVKAYVEEDRSLQDMLRANQLDPVVVRRVTRMVDRAEYKRRQGAPGIKITPKAFGKDRRMPITNRYEQSK